MRSSFRCLGHHIIELDVGRRRGRVVEEVGAVEPPGEVDKGGIALSADTLEDSADGLGDGGVALEPAKARAAPPARAGRGARALQSPSRPS